MPLASFRTKLFVAALSTAILALVVAGALFSGLMRRQSDQRLEQTLVADARLAAELLSHGPEQADPMALDQEADRMGQLLSDQVTLVEDGTPRAAKLAKAPGWVSGHVAAQALKPGGGAVVESGTAGDFEKDQPFSVSVWVKPTKNNLTGAVVARMDETNNYRGWDIYLEGGDHMTLVHVSRTQFARLMSEAQHGRFSAHD